MPGICLSCHLSLFAQLPLVRKPTDNWERRPTWMRIVAGGPSLCCKSLCYIRNHCKVSIFASLHNSFFPAECSSLSFISPVLSQAGEGRIHSSHGKVQPCWRQWSCSHLHHLKIWPFDWNWLIISATPGHVAPCLLNCQFNQNLTCCFKYDFSCWTTQAVTVFLCVCLVYTMNS